MAKELPRTSRQICSLITSSGELQLSIAEAALPAPTAAEVIVRVEAAPLNPSDLGLLFGAADLGTAKSSGTRLAPVVTANVPPAGLRAMQGRLDQSLPVGNEGAGTVIAAGSSAEAQALLGRTVALLGGAMYSEYRCVPASQCMALPAGTTAVDGASAFVNPLTALAMVETMRREGHKALVQTAAASNLGQMLNRVCLQDGIDLVNIVRKQDQEDLLRGMGARYVCNSNAPSFLKDLTEALAATGATLAFDAIGGGKLAGQILACMESVISRTVTEYSRYGSTVHKQVYIYGALDRSPTEIVRSFGLTWGLGGWLLFPAMQKLGPEVTRQMKERVAAQLKTTFASHYTKHISLDEALQLEEIAIYSQQATGSKYLLCPHKNA